MCLGVTGSTGFIVGLGRAGQAGTVVATVLRAALVLAVVLTLAHWVRSAATLLIGVMAGTAGATATSVLVVYDDLRLLSLNVSRLGTAMLALRALNALLLDKGYFAR
ncbi:hypothetical protein [Mycobacterium uberis]|uniref:hypothetical protein n=1 Tax=Mycobacterium uberis TaxID=2162698 RepID=UPI001FB53D58|nr:hypothetical protein [Mycobacterium uberis]